MPRILTPTVAYASLLHLIWSVLLLFSPAPEGATSVRILTNLTTNRFVLSATLTVIAALALYAVLAGATLHGRYVLLLPQHFVLIASATAAATAIWTGHYGDGVARPRPFIAADQGSYIMLAIFYTVVCLAVERRLWRVGRQQSG